MDDMEELISRLSLFKKPNLENVGEVTSAEYYYDPQSHLSTHEQIVNDTDTLETFREWIEENPHIIKVQIYFRNSFRSPFRIFIPYFGFAE